MFLNEKQIKEQYDSIKKIAEKEKKKGGAEYAPIFELLLTEKTGEEEQIYPSGKRSGFPDTGTQDTAGYYHNIDDAITAMHYNNGDLRETIYDAGFVLCRFPGVYQPVTKEMRIFFLWDAEKEGYYEAEEPPLWGHLAL